MKRAADEEKGGSGGRKGGEQEEGKTRSKGNENEKLRRFIKKF